MMAKSRPKTGHNPSAVPTTKEKQDEAIIGTNDYSIVSKRSVEKLYYRNEPEFLRPFVDKFKRRAPLINRGYWLRMRAIENTVKNFLEEETEKSKVIVNLGCGYEPLPFRMLWKYSSKCRNVKFVDVDYPQLVRKKVEVIRKNSLFSNLLKNHQPSDEIKTSFGVMLSDEMYCAVGCDLGDVKSLDQIFRTELQVDTNSILFIGEVSIVYMEVQKADDLIAWASRFSDARICLLEQHLPEGSGHPFAKTMLEHFQKQTPLRCLTEYNTMQDQGERFRKAGWSKVQIRDLWSLWQADDIGLSERIAIEAIEPFDEWEELALFAGHYFLLFASTDVPLSDHENVSSISNGGRQDIANQTSNQILISSEENPKGQGLRRFGAILNIDHNSLAFHGGLTSTTRQSNCDIYKTPQSSELFTSPPEDIICHTITNLHDGSALLVGGRNSPAKASPKCLLRERGSWTPVHELSPARYRHCSVSVKVDSTSYVLTFGGRMSTAEVLDSWSLFDRGHGWRTLKLATPHPPALFGAAMLATGDRSGILIGGMTAGGMLSPQFLEWTIVGSWDELEVQFRSKLPDLGQHGADDSMVMRFGATLLNSKWGLLLLGGIGIRGVIPLSEEILLVHPDGKMEELGRILTSEIPRPLLVGFGAATVDDGNVMIVGGSSVCFSFGAFWNEKAYILHPKGDSTASKWTLPVEAENKQNSNPGVDFAQDDQTHPHHPVLRLQETQALAHATPIPCTEVTSAESFQTLITLGHPTIIRNLPLGPCTHLWTPSYLATKIGSTTPITIHSAATPYLSFHPKNFTYETLPFAPFIDSAISGSHVYLRALSTSNPSKLAASLSRDFPGIADDFQVPKQLEHAKLNEHSSVLRVSGNIAMWLHYDVMSNILCQIKGSKRVVLFPPSDVSHLHFPPGETTSNLQVFTAENDSLGMTHPVETILHEGEVLFIPACWPHATAPSGTDLSVAVNVFFKSLQDGYAAGRDVYGNRDLEAYQNGRRDVGRIIEMFQKIQQQDKRPDIESLAESLRRGKNESNGRGSKEIERVLKSLEGLPVDIAEFYRVRLADELLTGLHL